MVWLDILEVDEQTGNTARSVWILGSGFIPPDIASGAWCYVHQPQIQYFTGTAVLAADLVSTLIRDA